ncbi:MULTISPECIES: HAD family phosphatase [Coprobacillaceae]|uniref:HAD family hydrolase n=1 Tax=Coprobacillaceae TaxID=2810280 RepID=UPI000E4D8FA1|nr:MULTISPECIES: HAD family phosphatase [Coprobacillaceae]RHM62890.1 HAD family phosphatase [Coprobacillus sp. AF33-1AC]RHS94969.1 HAD family phosphatase [Erysipelatoclostridium sp. AM42-17]
MLKKKAVIFDMDGLMIDSERIALKTNIEVHQEYGYPLDESVALDLVGRNLANTKAYLEDYFGEGYPFDIIRKETVKRRMDYYKENPLQMKKGLVPLLDYLKKEKIKTAVASSTRKARIIENLKEIKVLEYFDYIVGGDQIVHGKPAPDIFLDACHALKVKPQEALVLEDSKNGILAAVNGNIDVICIPDLVQHPQEILDLTYCTLDSLDQVINEVTSDD